VTQAVVLKAAIIVKNNEESLDSHTLQVHIASV